MPLIILWRYEFDYVFLMGNSLYCPSTPLLNIEETVSVISSDPPCKDGNARFTTVLLKALSDQVWIRYACFCVIKLFYFHLRFLCISCLFETTEKFTEIDTFLVRKQDSFYIFDQITGTGLNRALLCRVEGYLKLRLQILKTKIPPGYVWSVYFY